MHMLERNGVKTVPEYKLTASNSRQVKCINFREIWIQPNNAINKQNVNVYQISKVWALSTAKQILIASIGKWSAASELYRPRHTMRQIAATCRRDRLLQQIASCDMWKSLSLRSVAQIQTSLNLCDTSQRQTKRKLLVAAAVQTRRRVAVTCRRDLSHRVSRPYMSYVEDVVEGWVNMSY